MYDLSNTTVLANRSMYLFSGSESTFTGKLKKFKITLLPHTFNNYRVHIDTLTLTPNRSQRRSLWLNDNRVTHRTDGDPMFSFFSWGKGVGGVHDVVRIDSKYKHNNERTLSPLHTATHSQVAKYQD